EEIYELDLSPDGRLVAVGTHAGLAVWEYLDGGELEVLDTQPQRISGLRFSPDGRRLVTSGEWQHPLRVWDVAERRVVRTVGNPSQIGYITRLKFLPDGRSVVTGDYDKRSISIWDLQTRKRTKHFDLSPAWAAALAVSPDGRWLAAKVGAQIRLWDLETGAPVAEEYIGHRAAVSATAFADDGRTLVTASDDGTVRLWDARTSQLRRQFVHGRWVRDADISPDGRWIVSASLDNTNRLWGVETGEEVYRLAGHGSFGGRRAAAFARDGHRFATWGDDMFLRVWDPGTGKAVLEHAIRPSGMRIAEKDDGTPADPHLHSRIDGATFSPRLTRFALGARRTVWLYDVETGREVMKVSGEHDAQGGLAISPDDHLLLSSGRPIEVTDTGDRFFSQRNHALILQHLPSGEELWRFPLPEGGAGPVAFSADGRLMSAGLHRPYEKILVWDVASRRLLHEITGVHGIAWRHSLTFSPDGRWLACGLQDTTALMWDLEKLRRKGVAAESREP
ncbi:MAG TPA: WD40 repeat domain-containing protein, partial [Planctomycetaceae bacterium]|nr:WD40 repeat domain-containing protein [Planctomycetaceae bacterium]